MSTSSLTNKSTPPSARGESWTGILVFSCVASSVLAFLAGASCGLLWARSHVERFGCDTASSIFFERITPQPAPMPAAESTNGSPSSSAFNQLDNKQ